MCLVLRVQGAEMNRAAGGPKEGDGEAKTHLPDCWVLSPGRVSALWEGPLARGRGGTEG